MMLALDYKKVEFGLSSHNFQALHSDSDEVLVSDWFGHELFLNSLTFRAPQNVPTY